MTRTILLAALLALAVPAALAEHKPMGLCDSGGEPALGIVEITGGSADATFYVDDRNYATGNGLWVYQESGGRWVGRGPGVFNDDVAAHNLQRGGSSWLAPDDNESCVDDPLVVPDIIVL